MSQIAFSQFGSTRGSWWSWIFPISLTAWQ